MFPVLAGNSASTGYNLTRSLRFRANASAYLNRTPASTTNRQIWTYSAWVKLGVLSAYREIFSAGTADLTRTAVFFDLNNCLVIINSDGTNYYGTITTAVFRDPSAWYHVVCAVDTTQATTANRVKFYINGVQQTATTPYTSGYIPQNTNTYVNVTNPHSIGSNPPYSLNNFFDGYLTEVNFVDGLQLTPSSFGSTNALTGVWQPARYTGTYGTNGFYLPFTDNSALTTSSNVGLGKDFSGNGNYWATNNISLTSGTTYDSMTDVPTLTSATAANFAVLNPLDSNANVTVSNGNLLMATSAVNYGVRGSIGVNSGKYYWEATVVALGSTNVGIGVADFAWSKDYVGSSASSWSYFSSSQKYNNASATAYGSTYTTGDVIGVAFDATAGTLTFYKNNTSQGTAFTGVTSLLPIAPALSGQTSSSIAINLGQQPFTYTPPTGFVALNTYNLPTSTILQGNKVMDATLWTGNGTSQNITNAAGFKPDLIWDKMRSGAYYNILTDSVRGTNSQLFSNDTLAQETRTDRITAFNSNGFSVGSYADVNANAQTFVGWQWQAGQGSTSSNTSGSITSTVSVNASAGFSVVTYTGNGLVPGATIGHGLGVAPQFIIVKNRSTGSTDWPVYHKSIGATNWLALDTTQASAANSVIWNDTAPTSSVFSVGYSLYVNAVVNNYVAYCWTPIAGYSAFGTYAGNGSTDGPFMYTGFKPKWVMIKCFGAAASWVILDSARDVYNPETNALLADSSAAEGSGYLVDFLSNGFKVKNTGSGTNSAGTGYIYVAFAENPFKNSLAR